jgi:hypothetical protein
MDLHQEDREQYEGGECKRSENSEEVFGVNRGVVTQVRFNLNHVFAAIQRNVEADV